MRSNGDGDGTRPRRSFAALARTIMCLGSDWINGRQPEQEDGGLRDSLVNGDQFIDTPLEVSLDRMRQRADRLAAIVYCVLLVGFATVVVGSSFVSFMDSAGLTSILCSCNVVMYIVTGLLQHHLEAQVKKERRQGFITFSERLELIVQLPCPLISIASLAILLVLAWEKYMVKAGIPPFLLVRFILLVEILWTGALVGLYIWAVHSHDSSPDIEPDALDQLYSVLQPPTPLGDLRYIDGKGLADQQATLLRYQQENISFLSEEILRLQESLSKYESSQDGVTPQVDVTHLLSAREQELRAVAAERDQLQAEIRLARSYIAERDSDILRIKTVNDKYVVENDRIRGMLDEWSARNAKLELALEAERLANVELRKRLVAAQQAEPETTTK